MNQTHFRTCSLCEAMCGLKIEYDGDTILSVKGDPEDPHSKGNICPKGNAIQDLHNDPDRLRHPVKRKDGAWVKISWEEALDEVANRLVSVQQKYGRDAVATYWGNPSAHNTGTTLMIGPFNKCLGTKNNFSATSVDQLPHQFVQYFMYGHTLMFTIPDIDRTDYMLMLGANPAASNGSLWSCGDVTRRMKELISRGGKMILIDPRRTETARYATEHHFITPGTDAVFLLAILRTLFEKVLVNPSHLKSWLKGWEDIEPLSRAFTLDQAALITGIPATEIERIAVDFGSANAAICYGRMGVSTQEFGALCQWLIQVINIATGNLDRAGGMMFSRPAIDLLRSEARGSFDTYRSRVRGLAEFGRELPSSVLAEEMLTEGEGQIKAFITTAGNPVLSTPNGKKLEQALPELEFMASIDFYINETTCHADIILPPTGPLEHGHYDLVFNLFAVRDVAKFSSPMFKPVPGALNDRKIYQGLISRINRLRGKKTSLKERMWVGLQKLFPYLASNQFVLDLGLRLGPYGKGFVPFAKGLSLKRLKRNPHGIDLGPLKSALPDRLFTKDKKIDVAPKILTEDLVRLKARYANMEQSTQDNGHLLLIGRRDVRTNNSWMHNSLRLVKGKNRCTLLIHPDDAARHTIADGQLVTVTSRTGTLTANAEITDAIYRGVVSLPHGWGHDRSGISMDVASAHAGVSVNDITDDLLIDQVCGNASVNGVPVTLNIRANQILENTL